MVTIDRISRLADHYRFDDPDRVRAYLAARSNVVSVLETVWPQVPRYFGDDATVTLEILDDPACDVPEEFLEIVGVVRNRMPWDLRHAALRTFEENSVEAFGPAPQLFFSLDLGE